MHHEGRPDLFRVNAQKYGPSQVLDMLGKMPIFVAVEGQTMLGYCFCVIEEVKDDPVLRDVKNLYIDDLCVDENDLIVGLFDFNMSGTEVIANYLANNAFMGHFCYEDEILDKHTPKEVLQILLDAFHQSTALICEHYSFTEQEFSAYLLYGKIAMISAYWNASTFGEYLQQEKYKDKIVAIIELILAEDLS